MARRKTTPTLSTITRPSTVAYARKQKSGADDEPDGDDEGPASDAEVVKAALATMKMPQQTDAKEPQDRPTMPLDPKLLASALANNGEPEPARGRVDTASMPLGGFGEPPEIPVAAPSPVKGGVVENPTHMPGPREIPSGNPDDLAPPPGLVPPGDSRSLRRRGDRYEFALVYRVANAVISRSGVVGTRGVWRVVEYPTTASASNAYAREASRFVSEGFSDYRE